MVKPLITILTICFNQSQYVETWYNGIVSQVNDAYDLEVIVCDDASSDNTLDRLFEVGQLQRDRLNYLDPGSTIHIHTNTVNLGGPANLTKAIGLMSPRSEYCLMLEMDDYYKPGKLIKSLNFMLENDLDGVHTEISAILPDGTWIERGWQNICRPQPEVIDFDTLAANNCVYTCTFMAKSELIRKAPTPATFATKFYHLGDYPLLLYLLHSGAKLGYLNEPLSVYREGVGINNSKRALTVEADARIKDWAWKGCPVEGYFEPN